MQAQTVARGHDLDEDMLPEVSAYLDWRAFGSLPAAGGTMDQPAWLMDGMRVVHVIVSEHERREQEREARKRKR